MTSPQKNLAWTALLILAAALAVGGWLRFAGLSTQGITTWDGAFYANVARGPAVALERLGQAGGGGEGLLRYLRLNGVEFTAVKAGHLALLALGFLIMGVSQFSALLPMALCGWLAIPLLYLLGARFFSRGAGVLGAAMLSVAVLHVAYSRTAYPQTDTALFFLAAVFFYLRSLPGPEREQSGPRSERRDLLLCSLLGGLALTMHPSVVTALGGLALNEFLLLAGDHGPGRGRRFLRRVLLLACLLPVSMLLVEAVCAGLAIGGGFHLDSTLDYFLGGGGTVAKSHVGFFLERLWFFPNRFWYSEGPLFALLGGLGLVYGALGLKQGGRLRAMWLPVVVQLVFWSFSYSTTKALTVVLPLLYLLAGLALQAGLARISDWRPVLGRAGLILLAALILANGAWRSWGVLEHRNGYLQATRELTAYMAKHGGTFSLWEQSIHIHPLLRFYLGEARRRLPSDFAGRIVLDAPAPGDYLFINETWNPQDLPPGKLHELMTKERPIIKVPHLQRQFLPSFKAHRGMLSYDIAHSEPRQSYICIFDKRLLK